MMITVWTLFMMASVIGDVKDAQALEYQTQKECEIANEFLNNKGYCMKTSYVNEERKIMARIYPKFVEVNKYESTIFSPNDEKWEDMEDGTYRLTVVKNGKMYRAIGRDMGKIRDRLNTLIRNGGKI